MKKVQFALIYTFLQCIVSVSHAQNPTILKAVQQKFAELSSVSYHYQTEIKNGEGDRQIRYAGDTYLEFDLQDKRSVERFLINSNQSTLTYDGVDFLIANHRTKTYTIEKDPKPEVFKNLLVFLNTYAAIRYSLPDIIENPSVVRKERDTIIQGKSYRNVTLQMFRSSLGYYGSAMQFTKDVTLQYNLIIDVENSMPFQVIQRNASGMLGNETKVTFTAVNLVPVKPSNAAWQMTSIPAGYKLKPGRNASSLPAVGDSIPPWSLPVYAKGNKDTLCKQSDMNNKVIMIDFWMKNCGPCIESFSDMKEISSKFASPNFELLAINAYDQRVDIATIFKKETPNYRILYQGKSFADKIGVESYPSILLVSAKGRVLYAGSFNKEKIIRIISNELNAMKL